MCGSDAMGEAGMSCCQSHRHPIHPTSNQAPAGKEEACETRLAQLQTPTTHPRPDERTSALWALHLLLIYFICPPPAPALRLTPLPESSWAGSLMWSINLWKQDEILHASMNFQKTIPSLKMRTPSDALSMFDEVSEEITSAL